MNLQISHESKFPVPWRRSTSVGDVIGAFESETAAVFLRTAPVNEHLVLYVLSAIIALVVVLAAIVKVDIVVTSVAGYLMPLGGQLYVDPLAQGIVREVNVKPGQVVKKGQALATLDPTFTQADLNQLKDHFASDEAQITREEAELARRPYIFASADTYQRIQGQIWVERSAQYKAAVSNFDGQILSATAQMKQAQSDVEKYSKRLGYAVEAENVYQPLLEKGYVSKLQAMQSQDTRTEMSRLLADAEQEVTEYRENAEALKAQREAYIKQWFGDISTQLVADRNDFETTRESLDKAQKMQDLTSLDAPEDAVVLKVNKASIGSVAAAGGQDSNPGTDPLFTLMPLNSPVEAEIDVTTADNAYIAVGDSVSLKFDAYPYVRHGYAKGLVKSISEGSFTTDINNQPTAPYFKVRVTIKQSNLRDVPKDFRLIPGMTLTGDVLCGRRTILSYVIEGVMRTSEEALREPQ